MALDATPGGATSNSYATVDEANAYHATRLYSDAWDAADPGDQEKVLLWATRLLDEQVAWKGQVATNTQALRWPRGAVFGPDGIEIPNTSIPAWLKNATAELARSLLAGDRSAEPEAVPTRVKADVVEIELDQPGAVGVLPASVLSMIERYGDVSVTGRGGSSGMAKLQRV